MAMLAILILPLSILGFTALAVVLPAGTGAMGNAGPHGFSEALYAYTSATGNNGSAFAGLSAKRAVLERDARRSPCWSGASCSSCRCWRWPGRWRAKKIVPPSAGTFPTHGGLFVGLVVGVILIVGGLTFFPALALGPVVEQLAMGAGTTF